MTPPGVKRLPRTNANVLSFIPNSYRKWKGYRITPPHLSAWGRHLFDQPGHELFDPMAEKSISWPYEPLVQWGLESFLNFSDCMRTGSKKPTSHIPFHGPTSFATQCQHKPSTTHRFQSLDLIRFTDNTRYVEFVDSNSPTQALLRQVPTRVSQLPSWR